MLRKNSISKTILTFLLASLLGTLVSSAVSMGGENSIMQKADAQFTIEDSSIIHVTNLMQV
jgi:hypothetical protein